MFLSNIHFNQNLKSFCINYKPFGNFRTVSIMNSSFRNIKSNTAMVWIIKVYFLNIQTDAPIIQFYSVINSTCFGHLLCPSSRVLYRTFGTGFMQGSDDRFQTESGRNCSSILTLLGSVHQTPAWNLPVPNVRYKTPDDGQRRCPNMKSFITE
jgi:hypothetical protein